MVLYDGNVNLDKEEIKKKLGAESSARIIAGPFRRSSWGNWTLLC